MTELQDFYRRINETIENIKFLSLETIEENITRIEKAKKNYDRLMESNGDKDIKKVQELNKVEIISHEAASFVNAQYFSVYVWDQKYLNELKKYRLEKRNPKLF